MSLGWVNVLARMNVRPNVQAYEHNQPKKVKNIRKNFTNYVIIINIEREIIILQLWAWYGNSGHLPPQKKKIDKSCNLVSSEVLLKLCFIESNLL